MPPIAIEIEGVSKRFRKPTRAPLATTLKSFLLKDAWRSRERQHGKDAIWALRDINIAFERGRTVGIIGRNGSGKSTLLKLIGRILGPDSGRVAVHGKVAALIELGAGFHPELTGRENIMINGVILGLSRQEIKACMAPIIEFADIGDFIDYPVRTYSSGMYARLGFAVAVHVDPDILLIDEILSVGDADFSKKCHAALDAFKARQKLIIVVTHSLDTVRDWCDEAVWLDGGTLRARGASTDIVAQYEEATA